MSKANKSNKLITVVVLLAVTLIALTALLLMQGGFGNGLANTSPTPSGNVSQSPGATPVDTTPEPTLLRSRHRHLRLLILSCLFLKYRIHPPWSARLLFLRNLPEKFSDGGPLHILYTRIIKRLITSLNMYWHSPLTRHIQSRQE